MAFIVLALLLTGFLWFLHSFSAATTDVTNPARYAQILAQLHSQVDDPAITLAHFPPAIPPGANNVRFFYRPHFLQGGTILQLRCRLPATQVNQIAAATTAATRPTTQRADYGPVNFRDAANTGWADLPPDFQIYILGSKMDQFGAEWKYQYGIAISLQSNEVIYWLEN